MRNRTGKRQEREIEGSLFHYCILRFIYMAVSEVGRRQRWCQRRIQTNKRKKGNKVMEPLLLYSQWYSRFLSPIKEVITRVRECSALRCIFIGRSMGHTGSTSSSVLYAHKRAPARPTRTCQSNKRERRHWQYLVSWWAPLIFQWLHFFSPLHGHLSSRDVMTQSFYASFTTLIIRRVSPLLMSFLGKVVKFGQYASIHLTFE